MELNKITVRYWLLGCNPELPLIGHYYLMECMGRWSLFDIDFIEAAGIDVLKKEGSGEE